VLAQLIASHETVLRDRRIPPSVAILVEGAFRRVLHDTHDTAEGFYRHENDLFAKDLATCRLKLLPCGSELIDVCAGVSRHVLLRGGASQLLTGAWFFVAKARGFRSWYESHWDRRLIREFTPRAYDQCYHRISELLELNPQIRGVMSSSWWFDPVLESISPELAFLRTVPEKAGAVLLRIGVDADSTRDAIRFSRERARLCAGGTYTPTVFMLAWHRHDLIRWSRRGGT
jgi:hypothetical protein